MEQYIITRTECIGECVIPTVYAISTYEEKMNIDFEKCRAETHLQMIRTLHEKGENPIIKRSWNLFDNQYEFENEQKDYRFILTITHIKNGEMNQIAGIEPFKRRDETK